ncbi:MAG: hypothetical protein RL140_218 [Actinomycetota bacterium]|jgi:hypothetical protein
MTPANNSNGKGRPTPARKEREAARKKPLVAPRTKEGKKASAEERRKANIAAREGYAAGDDRYLTKRDAGPVKRLIRDYVDSRWFTTGEILLPAMVLAVFITAPGLADILNVVVLVIFGVFLLESFLLTRGVKKIIAKKFGNKDEKGVWLYVAFRALYPRFFRLPRPQVARGTKF